MGSGSSCSVDPGSSSHFAWQPSLRPDALLRTMSEPDARVTLNDGRMMPRYGLGVWQADGRDCTRAVQTALGFGYRLIDTASVYGNEREVGEGVRAAALPREEVFITTKVWNTDQGFDSTLRACGASLARLGMDYVDLYLIHWPSPRHRKETWKALLELQKEGKARSIGVSNYTIRHLEELQADSPVVPAVNQVEFSPFLYQKELLAYCAKHKIQLEGYSPLARARRFRDPVLVELASKYGRTPAQIMLRWALQHEIVVIPKSVRAERIRENGQVFDFQISAKDMGRLDGLHDAYRTDWNPERVG